MAFEQNVFINCPFDEGFYGLLRPLLFTVIYLGFKPRIALERTDSGEPRIDKIVELITDSKYAIHDLSRIKAKKAGELLRFNMPFELGIDVGCRLFKGGGWAQKKSLILEAQRYRYQAALSDLSSSDIAVHYNKPKDVVIEVRNWLNNQCRLNAAGPAKIWGRSRILWLTTMTNSLSEVFRRGISRNWPYQNSWIVWENGLIKRVSVCADEHLT